MKSKIFAFTEDTLLTKGIWRSSDITEDYDISKNGLEIKKFADGEISVDFKEAVRGYHVFLVGSTNTSDHIMKLVLATDAAKRANAKSVTAIVPYFGYARQDKKDDLRGPIGARVVATMLEASGLDKIITCDLHSDQIQGFFRIPVDHIRGHHIFAPNLKELIDANPEMKPTICSPDAGGAKRAQKHMKKLMTLCPDKDFTYSQLNKVRVKPNEVAHMDLIGDVKGRDVFIFDDMVDTAGTLCKAADLITQAGANSVRAVCTHGVLSGPALERIGKSTINKLYITNSLPMSERNFTVTGSEYAGVEKIEIVSCAKMIGKIVKAIHEDVSAEYLINH